MGLRSLALVKLLDVLSHAPVGYSSRALLAVSGADRRLLMEVAMLDEACCVLSRWPEEV